MFGSAECPLWVQAQMIMTTGVMMIVVVIEYLANILQRVGAVELSYDSLVCRLD